MGENVHTGQLRGPFAALDELIELIKQDAKYDFNYVDHLGIQVNPDDAIAVVINNGEVEIGKNGIYEIGNTEITSIYFKEDVDSNTLIDYTIK